MQKSAEITIWGTRGSFPVTREEVRMYGRDTSCISVETAQALYIFDAGSGLVRLGMKIREEGIRKPMHLFLSHFHLDHLMGFFEFLPFFDPETEMHIYGEGGSDGTLRQRLCRLVGEPFWPVGFASFPASVQFHEIQAGDRLKPEPEAVAETVCGDHPGGSILYRLYLDGKSLVYGLDCELVPETVERLAAFAKGCEYLFCDGQYAPEDLKAHRGWGHSSWKEASDLGKRALAGRVVMMHYACEYSDGQIAQQEKEAAASDERIHFSREGEVLAL